MRALKHLREDLGWTCYPEAGAHRESASHRFFTIDAYIGDGTQREPWYEVYCVATNYTSLCKTENGISTAATPNDGPSHPCEMCENQQHFL